MEKKSKNKKRAAKPRIQELALTGVGVEITTDPKLIALGHEHQDVRCEKSQNTKRLKELDAEILNRMAIIGVKCFRIDDFFWRDNEKHTVKCVPYKDVKQPKTGEAPEDKTEGEA